MKRKTRGPDTRYRPCPRPFRVVAFETFGSDPPLLLSSVRAHSSRSGVPRVSKDEGSSGEGSDLSLGNPVGGRSHTAGVFLLLPGPQWMEDPVLRPLRVPGGVGRKDPGPGVSGTGRAEGPTPAVPPEPRDVGRTGPRTPGPVTEWTWGRRQGRVRRGGSDRLTVGLVGDRTSVPPTPTRGPDPSGTVIRTRRRTDRARRVPGHRTRDDGPTARDGRAVGSSPA